MAGPQGSLCEVRRRCFACRATAAAADATVAACEAGARTAVRRASTCRVCQTLMYGRLDQVGKPIKCPDCGAQTIVLPPPQPVKPKKQPAALEGEQYELWGVDEAPSVAEHAGGPAEVHRRRLPRCVRR